MAEKKGKGKREKGKGAHATTRLSLRPIFHFPFSLFLRWRSRLTSYLQRRPHRSFRRTRRRDLPQVPPLPSYIIFTGTVARAIWRLRWTYLGLLMIYLVVAILLIGIVNQGDYHVLSQALRDVAPDVIGGKADDTTRTLSIIGAAVTGGLNAPLTEAQQVYAVGLGLYGWLVIVWLLRSYFANHAVPRLRDAFYSAGAPIVPTICIALIALVQMLPGGLGIFAYIIASESGLLIGGVEQMVFAAAMVLLILLSLYWMTSTFLAAIIITIPGTYPMAAIRTAGDIALGRRLSLLLRVGWLALTLALLWLVLLVPAILLADLKQLAEVPLVPLVIQVATGVSLLWGTTYIYLLYRRIVDGISS